MNAMPASLAELNARVRHDLLCLTVPANPWVPKTRVGDQPVLDAVIIGGGMAGLAATTALTHNGLRTMTFDARPKGFEGPWATTARMETLRSPKTLTGPALGIPSLTFRAWFEAQFGADEWDRLDKIPRLQWMEYLRWYRDVLDIEIQNAHRVTDIRPEGDHVALEIDTPEGSLTRFARHVVLATGRDGLGGATVPEMAKALPRNRWAHSSDENDYAELAGKRVIVVGAGASAMDSAGTALEHGAVQVDLLIRRKDIPRVNRGMAMGNPGSVHGVQDLTDAWKWRLQTYLAREQVPPPRASMLRVSRHENAHFHLGCALESMAMEGNCIRIDTVKGVFRADFVIFATGFEVDWAKRPFLSRVAASARIWQDRIAPEDGSAFQTLLDLPDLGPGFEFQQKQPGDCPGLERVHCFCYPAVMSHGGVSGDIPAISEGAKRLARGITSSLFCEDVDVHFERMVNHDIPEIFGDEWTPAPQPLEVEA